MPEQFIRGVIHLGRLFRELLVWRTLCLGYIQLFRERLSEKSTKVHATTPKIHVRMLHNEQFLVLRNFVHAFTSSILRHFNIQC